MNKGDLLNFKQIQFVKEITDPESEGFMSPPKAHNKVYKSTWDSSRNYGYKLANNPAIRSAIEEQLERIGFGVGERIALAADFAQGKISRQVETALQNGEVVKTEETPNFTERLKSIELLNKMSALYERNKVEVDMVSSDLRKLQEEVRKEALKDITPKTTHPAGEETTDEAEEDAAWKDQFAQDEDNNQ